MATPIWTGNSLQKKQKDEWTFGGTWLATETITVTINGKAFDVLAGSTTIATIIATVQAALANESDEDFDSITWTEDTATKVAGEADTAGTPFTAVFSTDSAGGTIVKSSPAPQAVQGQSFWDNADCWEGAVPVATDTPKIANSAVPIKYSLDQSGILLSRLDIPASFTGQIGQMRYPTSGIKTFKGTSDRYLNIGITNLYIGDGEGNGSELIYIDVGANQLTALINKTAVPNNGEDYAVKLLGSHASNQVTVNRGRVGIADEPGQTATISKLVVGQVTNPADSRVFCGSGVTLTTVEVSGGLCILECGATNVTLTGGTLELCGTAAYTNVTVRGGTLIYRSSGTITTLKVSDDGQIDFSKDIRSRSITNPVEMGKGGVFDDRYGTINKPFVIEAPACAINDIAVYTQPNIQATFDDP